MHPSPLALALSLAAAPWAVARPRERVRTGVGPDELVDLSVVLCGRNDGHGGDFLSRVKWSVLSIGLGLCQRRHRLSAEIVLMEWRPPQDTARLRDIVFGWFREALPSGGFNCPREHLPRLRFITASQSDVTGMLRSFSLTLESPGSDGMEMLQWHCKNAGVLRAKGRFVLVTNADDFFSPELLDFLASVRDLRADTFYRAQTKTITLSSEIDASRFQLLFTAIFGPQFYGMAEEHAQKWALGDGVIASGTAHQLCRNVTLLSTALQGRLEHFWADHDAAFGVRLNESTLDYNGLWHPWNLYMDNPGDFLLASREAWAEVRGAPLLLQNHNVDMLLICRFASRFRQVVLVNPCVVATLDHPSPIHDKFRRLGRDISEAAEELAVSRSRLRNSHERLRAAEQGSPSLPSHPSLRAEVRRNYREVHRWGWATKRLKDTHELRIDNVFDRCRDPFRPFPSERRVEGVDPQDWGFAWMTLPEDVANWL